MIRVAFSLSVYTTTITVSATYQCVLQFAILFVVHIVHGFSVYDHHLLDNNYYLFYYYIKFQRQNRSRNIRGYLLESEEHMQQNMDTIKFEYRYEVQELLKVIDHYIDQNPKEKNNTILKDFFDKLDVMNMSW